MAVLQVVFWLALSLWTGALFAFAALVAPAVFAVSPTREEAGRVVGGALGRVQSFGIFAGLVLLVVTASQATLLGWPAPAIARLVAVALMLLLTLYNVTAVDRGMAAVRARMTRSLDEYEPDSPERLEYNRWHRLSVRVFGLALALGVLLIAWEAAGLQGGFAPPQPRI